MKTFAVILFCLAALFVLLPCPADAGVRIYNYGVPGYGAYVAPSVSVEVGLPATYYVPPPAVTYYAPPAPVLTGYRVYAPAPVLVTKTRTHVHHHYHHHTTRVSVKTR
jgi:hypothetical protein